MASGEKGQPTAETADNVVALRPYTRGKSHPFEIVEIFPFNLQAQQELWIALAGPWRSAAEKPWRGRAPWRLVAKYPLSDVGAAARFARELADELGVRIVDLAGVMTSDTTL